MTLGPVTLSFVGATGKDDLARIAELRQRHGRDGPAQWLQTRGAVDADTLLSA